MRLQALPNVPEMADVTRALQGVVLARRKIYVERIYDILDDCVLAI